MAKVSEYLKNKIDEESNKAVSQGSGKVSDYLKKKIAEENATSEKPASYYSELARNAEIDKTPSYSSLSRDYSVPEEEPMGSRYQSALDSMAIANDDLNSSDMLSAYEKYKAQAAEDERIRSEALDRLASTLGSGISSLKGYTPISADSIPDSIAITGAKDLSEYASTPAFVERRRERLAAQQEAQDQRLREYEQMRNDPSFSNDSAYTSTYGRNGIFGTEGFSDSFYDYVNKDERAALIQRGRDGADRSNVEQMTADEVSMYNYIYKTRGSQAAKQYIDDISGTLNERQRGVREAAARETAAEHPVLSTAGTILSGPFKAADYAAQAADWLIDGKIDQNASYNSHSYTSGAIRDEVSKKAEKTWGKPGSFLYQTGVSMGDFLFNALVTGGLGSASGMSSKAAENLSLGIMGASAAADSVVEAKDRGLSDNQAFALGTIAGLAEVITEKVSLEALLDKTSLEKSIAGYLAKNILSEGSEEVASDIINLFADVIISKDKSEWHRAVDAYKAQGMSESEAFGMAFKDQAAQTGLSFLGGALSGGVMAGGAVALGSVQNSSVYGIKSTGEYQAIVDEGLASAENTEAHKIALTNQQKLNETGKLSTLDVYRQVRANGKAISGENVNAEADGINSSVDASPASDIENKAVATDLSASETAQSMNESPAGEVRSNGLSEAQSASAQQARYNALEADPVGDQLRRNLEKSTKDLVSGMGDMGQKLLGRMFGGTENAGQYAADFVSVYEAAKAGRAVSSTRLNPVQVEAARFAAEADSRQNISGISETEDMRNGRTEEVHLREGGERYDGQNTGGQVSAVEEGAGRDSFRQAPGRPADSEGAQLKAGEEVSAAAFGIAGGTTERVWTVDAASETSSMKEARQIAREAGLRPVFYMGGYLSVVKNGTRYEGIRGCIVGDRVFIRADDPDFNSAQLMRHEETHDLIRQGKVDLDDVRNRIEATMPGGTKAAVERYAAAYEGSGMSADEIFEEIVCDARAGMNIFAGEATLNERAQGEYNEQVRKSVEVRETNQARAPDEGISFSRDLSTEEDKVKVVAKVKENWQDLVNGRVLADVVYRKRGGRNIREKTNEILDYYKTLGIYDNKNQTVSRQEDNRAYLLDRTAVNSAGKHVNTDMEYSAIFAAPYVIRNGRQIFFGKKTADRYTYSKIFAGKVSIGGNPLIVAVVANYDNKGRLHAVRVFDISDADVENKTEPTSYGITADAVQGPSIGSASKNNISERTTKSNSKSSDMHFSMKSPVEQKGDLVALHNLSADKLSKAIELGGFPMPSIAVTKSDIPHTNFGNITLVMNKSTVDPKADKRNTVYSADAWTPTFPSTEYEVDESVASKLRSKYYDLYKKFGNDATRPLYAWANYADDELNQVGGVEKVISQAQDDTDMMKLYLMDQGMDVPAPITEESVKRMDEGTMRFYDHFVDALGEDAFRELSAQEGKTIPQVRKEWWAAHGEAFEDAYRAYMSDLGFTEEQMDNVLDKETVASQTRKALEIRNYILHGPETRTVTTNTAKTNDAIRAAVDTDAYSEWLHGLFDGLEKNRGIYNGKDRYTSSGNRRSFSATHVPATLENIAKVMASQNDGNSRNVDGFYGIKSLRAGMAERFSSIERMHEMEGRLQHLTEEEAAQINDALSNRLTELMGRIYDSKAHGPYDNSFIEMDSIGAMLMEATETRPITIDAIVKAFKGSGYKISNQIAADVRDLLFDVSQMPVNIYEAKPERAVRFDEVLAAVVPDGTDAGLIESLKGAGVANVLTYESGNNEDRLAKVNSVEGAKFSMKGGKSLIKAGMSEEERYEILKDKKSAFVRYKSSHDQDLNQKDKTVLKEQNVGGARKVLKRYAKSQGMLKRYHHQETGLDFVFSGHNLEESVYRQSKVDLDDKYEMFSKMLTCMDEIVENAVEIEVHDPMKNEEDGDLKAIHVLASSFSIDDDVIPVKLVIKEFAKKDNGLYVILTLDKIKEKALTGPSPKGKMSQAISEYNLSNYLREVKKNPINEVLSKYIPYQFAAEPAKTSLKGTENAASLGIRKKNAELREAVEELSSLKKQLARESARADRAEGQLKRTESPRIRRSDAERLAKDLKRSVQGTMDTTELSARLEALGNKIVSSEALDYSELKDEAVDIARDLIESARELTNGEELKVFQGIKDYLKGKKFFFDNSARYDANVSGYKAGDAELRKAGGEIPEYASFKRHNQGRFALINDPNAAKIDDAFMEMREMFGAEWFPEEVASVPDMVLHISELLDNMEPVFENPYSYDMAEAIEYGANEILEGLLDEGVRQTAPTYADKMEKKLERQRYDYGKKLKAIREQRDRKVADLKAHYREVAEAKRARREDSSARTRLLKIMKRLSNKKLDAVNRALLDQYIGDIDLVAKSITEQSVQKLSDLRDWYEDRARNDRDFIRDERIEDQIARLSKKHISELSQDEVADLTEVLLHIENELRTEKKLVDSQVKQELSDAGRRVIADIDASKGSEGGLVDRYFVTETLSPERQVKRITGYTDGDPLAVAAKELSEGQRKMFDYQRRASEKFAQWTNDKEFIREIAGRHAKEIEITGMGPKGPVTVKITPAMRMSLYLHSLNDQNLRHIAGGGITVPDMALYKKGDMLKALDKGVRIRLTPSELRAACAGMSAKERAFAHAIDNYYNGMSRNEINAVSELLKGYSLAGVDHYFPILTDKNFLKKEFDTVKMDGTIDGMGCLKERINSASPIMLLDVNEIVDRSVKQHSKYVGLAIPVRNFNKLWGVTVGAVAQDGTWDSWSDSVQAAVMRKWGANAKDYVERMMADVNESGGKGESWGMALSSIRSKYAGSVLTMNAGVAIKQAASYPTAAAVTGWGPLMKALKDPTNRKVDLNLIAKYTPLLWYRSQGFSSQELGDIKKQGRQLPKVLNWIQGMDVWTTTKLWTAAEYYVDENSPRLVRGTDSYYKAVAEVYNRIIEETQPNYTTMQRPQILRSSNELTKTLNMFKTQPFQNFNILYEAFGEMQAKRTAFMNVGTDKARAEFEAAKTKTARAVSSQLVSAVTFALMQFAWDALRGKDDKYKDDEDELAFLSWLKGMGLNVLSNGFGMLPYGGFMLEIGETTFDKVLKELGKDPFFDATYYGLEASPIEAVNNVAENGMKAIVQTVGIVNRTANGEDVNFESYARAMYSASENIAQFVGIPAANVRKSMEAVAYNGLKSMGPYVGRYYSTRLTSDPAKYPGDYYDVLYKAYKEDPKAYKEIYDLMLSEDSFGGNAAGEVFTEDKIRNAMETRMKKDQGVDKASELQQRYLPPDQQAAYDKQVKKLEGSSIWGDATDEQQKNAMSRLYEMTAGTSSGQKMSEKAKGGAEYGLDETKYILYQLALEMVDEPNSSGKMGTYTVSEKQAAADMAGLSQAAYEYLKK